MASGVAPALKARRTNSKRTLLLPTRKMPDGSSRSGTTTVKGSKSSVVIESAPSVKGVNSSIIIPEGCRRVERSRRKRIREPTRQHLSARNRPDDEKRLRPRRDRAGQGSVRRFVGQVLLAGEEPDERPALVRDVVADRAAQHRIAGLQRVEDRTLCDRASDIERHL